MQIYCIEAQTLLYIYWLLRKSSGMKKIRGDEMSNEMRRIASAEE